MPYYQAMKADILKYLKQDGPDRWLLTEPHLLYLGNESAQNYLEAMKNSQYTSGFHSETVKIITTNASSIVGALNQLCLIDLGPGYPDKTLPIARYCKEKQVNLKYVPVDINQDFLDIASGEIQKYTTDVEPVHSLFEDCADKIPNMIRDNVLVMIGLTFMNFPPNKILSLMKKIGGRRSRSLIACEILNPEISAENSIDEVLQRYQTSETQEVAFGPIKFLGVTRDDINYNVEFRNGRIEMSFRLRRPVTDTNLSVGSTIVTAVSYRFTESELRQNIQPHFNHTNFLWSGDRSTLVGILS